MNSILKNFSIFLLFFGVILSFCACGAKLKGVYQSEDVFGISTVYAFSGNDVSRTIKTDLGEKTVYGEYEIRESATGGLCIMLDFDEDDDSKEGIAWDFVKENDYIEIAGIRYKKIK